MLKWKEKITHKILDIELDKDFTLKPLFSPDFGLLSVDLLETLGTGTFGRVRLVRCIADKKYYALKMMKKSRIVRYKQLDHIQNEVKILSRLRCGFVCNLHAVFQDDNSLYLLLDYIPGGELFSYIRKIERLDPILYQFYACELVCALHYLHSLNIAYRDIKPENILVDRNGHVRLVDFGFAKIVEDRTYTICGTPEYLAPEVIQGSGHGVAVDWWALGILIFEMAAGYPPFYGDNPFTVYQKILEARVSYPSYFPTTTQAIIASLLTSNRVKRLGSGAGGFERLKLHTFFTGIEWNSAARLLLMPPAVPTVTSDGDTSNYDLYPDETSEEQANLTSQEREMFREFDRILDRPIQE